MTEQGHGDSQQRSPAERLAQARKQLAAATTEFQNAIAAVRDPTRRQDLTNSYVGLLQKALTSAQEGLDRYSQRRASRPPAGDTPPDSSGVGGH